MHRAEGTYPGVGGVVLIIAAHVFQFSIGRLWQNLYSTFSLIGMLVKQLKTFIAGITNIMGMTNRAYFVGSP